MDLHVYTYQSTDDALGYIDAETRAQALADAAADGTELAYLVQLPDRIDDGYQFTAMDY
jgi:hypothetical protein